MKESESVNARIEIIEIVADIIQEIVESRPELFDHEVDKEALDTPHPLAI